MSSSSPEELTQFPLLIQTPTISYSLGLDSKIAIITSPFVHTSQTQHEAYC